MKTALYLALAALMCGFWMPGPNYDRDRKREMKWLFREVGGQEKLSAFIDGAVQGKRILDGVDLSDAKLGKGWSYYGTHPQWLCYSGDWLLAHHDKDSEFEVLWLYGEDRAIVLTIRISDAQRLELVSMENQLVLILSWADQRQLDAARISSNHPLA